MFNCVTTLADLLGDKESLSGRVHPRYGHMQLYNIRCYVMLKHYPVHQLKIKLLKFVCPAAISCNSLNSCLRLLWHKINMIMFFITVTIKYNYEIPVTQSACFLFSHSTRVKPGQAPGSLTILVVHCSHS